MQEVWEKQTSFLLHQLGSVLHWWEPVKRPTRDPKELWNVVPGSAPRRKRKTLRLLSTSICVSSGCPTCFLHFVMEILFLLSFLTPPQLSHLVHGNLLDVGWRMVMWNNPSQWDKMNLDVMSGTAAAILGQAWGWSQHGDSKKERWKEPASTGSLVELLKQPVQKPILSLDLLINV